MSFLLAAPEALVTAASDLAGIGSAIDTAGVAAAAPTTAVLAAADDEISAQVAALFSEHGLGYQQLSAQVSAFHERFVQTLTAGANSYAAAEANAVQTLVSAATVGGGGGVGSVVSNAVAQVESAVQGAGVLGLPNLFGGSSLLARGAQAAGQAGAMLLGPTGGVGALTAASALLAPAAVTNAAVPAANALASIGEAIESAYLQVEPWVQYGFELASWAVGYLPYIGWLAPQINFFYNLFEPMVQSVLFNTIDFLDGTVTFTQGLANIYSATTASINQFIATEINWILGFFPPLPPLGVNV
ncbi:MAG: PE family protein [Mycobacterium sp.]